MFKNFLNILKRDGNGSVLESILKGYSIIFEGMPYMSAYQPETAVLPLQKSGLPIKYYYHETDKENLNDEVEHKLIALDQLLKEHINA